MVNSSLVDGYKSNMGLMGGELSSREQPRISVGAERIVVKQMCGHLSINHSFPEFQSAYRKFHSTVAYAQ